MIPTAQSIMQRTVRRLRDKENNLSTLATHVDIEHYPPNGGDDEGQGSDAFYSLGQNFGGEAQTRMKRFGPKWLPYNNNDRGRRLKIGWIRGIKGFSYADRSA